MSNILVTGGAGFIGSHIAAKLAADPNNLVIIADDLSTGRKRNIPKKKNIVFFDCDVNMLSEVIKIFLKHRIDYVFHYAAVVGVDRTLEHPVWVLRDIDGIENILNLSKDSGVKKIFYASSSEVYGESITYPQHEETTPLNSRLPYAVVKNVGEAFLKSYQQEYGLDYTIFRFFNTYGPNQRPDFVISKFIEAAKRNQDITIYGDGKQTRTFCYVNDNVDACLKTFDEEGSVVNDVVNIGSDAEISMNDLAKAIIKVTGSKSKVVHVPPLKEGDMPRRQPDITKMKQLLGRDFTPLEDGLKRCL
ncbi:MAG TPA: NAD-dependent epimerase/dehydratase family protein [Candidatus Dormibacteraeota bacterium]|nr:NAD-dependent epimerase/dehydratase family protein [Candidatus Dormibacteraeota bacterium]